MIENIKYCLLEKNRRRLISNKKRHYRRCKLKWYGKRGSDRLFVPYAIHVDSDSNRKTLMKFFMSLREKTLQRQIRLVLDFSNTEIVVSAGMLLFIAEIDRIKRILGSSFNITISNVRDKVVNQLLVRIGLYELCGQNPPKLSAEKFDERVKHWRYATGVRANEDTNRAFHQVEGCLSDELGKGMWKGISEAVINSVQHAYEKPRGTNGGRLKHSRWWMFSQVKDNILTVAVCDLGIGIPRSLPLKWDKSILSNIMGGIIGYGPDSQAIKAALELGATRTNAVNRGKGLPQIWKSLRMPGGIGIHILSNLGQLSWSSKNDKESSHEYSSSINGTVIIWSVRIEEAKGL